MKQMKKLQTLKGFRDFLPEEAEKRAWLKARMVEVFEKWGYEPLETPTLEPLELFAGEIGEDEKLFYRFTDLGGREVALRYDQTLPTVRVVGQYINEIPLPFRRYQIQSNFRAEKPQRGRFREFIQADIDIFGSKSPIADAEAVAVSLELYLTLGFKEVVALINNRDLMKGIPYDAIAAIDKIKKIGEGGVIDEMIKKGIEKEKAIEYLERVKKIKPDKIIDNIFSYLKASGFNEMNYRFEPTLARSFSYSEGPIWEMWIPGYEAGSVGGGERYDGLIKRITGMDIGGTGIGFGFDRTLEACRQFNLIPKLKTGPDVLVSVFNEECLIYSNKVAKRLRNNGIKTETYPDEKTKLEKQIKYADKKKIKWVVIAGPEEIKDNEVQLKNMESGEQRRLAINEVASEISN